MNYLQNFIGWIGVSSGFVHIFCCGLPIIFSVVGLLSGVGVFVALPSGLEHLHEQMHDFEVPMLLFSGGVIVLGGLAHFIAYRLDCRSDGCCHEPCKPQKKRSMKILSLAAVLYIVNVLAYLFVHH